MYNNMWSEEIEPIYVDLNGKEVKRTPIDYPYNYDEYVVWKSKDFNKDNYSAVYSDRLVQWDRKKYNSCKQAIFKDKGYRFNGKNPKLINQFLNMYFDKEIKLTAILQGCNQWSGFPYLIFLYEE